MFSSSFLFSHSLSLSFHDTLVTKPRKEIKQSLAKRLILVDGLVATKLSQNVDTGLQEVRWKERVLTDCSHCYFLLHKPQGLVTATKDAQHATVLDLLRAEDRTPNTYPIGRLDRDTTMDLSVSNSFIPDTISKKNTR